MRNTVLHPFRRHLIELCVEDRLFAQLVEIAWEMERTMIYIASGSPL
jgi:hypothetical protein